MKMIWNDDTEKTTGISREEKYGKSKITYVELVRCKDCRHYTGKDCNYNDIFPAPGEDWYCADGERRQKNE